MTGHQEQAIAKRTSETYPNEHDFCDTCGCRDHRLIFMCVHHDCHEEKFFCVDDSTPCRACHQVYCERHAVEVLSVMQLCENCQFAHDEAALAKFEPQMELGLKLTGRMA